MKSTDYEVGIHRCLPCNCSHGTRSREMSNINRSIISSSSKFILISNTTTTKAFSTSTCLHSSCGNLTSSHSSQLPTTTSTQASTNCLKAPCAVNATRTNHTVSELEKSKTASSTHVDLTTGHAAQPRYNLPSHDDVHHTSTSNCTSHNQLVFIKTHKTGSSTLRLIIDMYGYYRNLSFMLNKRNHRNGHIRYLRISQKGLLPPINVSKGDYKRYRNYDMLSVHFQYQRNLLNTVMKNSSRYVTILREPVSHFISAFVFFREAETVGIKGPTVTSKIEQWMQRPTHSRFLYNNQMLDLGIKTEDFDNAQKVDSHVERLSREFDLVLLMEYFDESLLLLRKMMCWSYEDILYLKQNVQQTTTDGKVKRKAELSLVLQDKIRRHNAADVQLYNHFNATFWSKVEQYGPTFRVDLENFHQRLDKVFATCVGGTTLQKQRDRGKTVVYKVSDNESDYCVLMINRREDVFKRVWQRQNSVSRE